MSRDQLSAGPWLAPASALATWRQSLGDLALACAGSFAADEAPRLRELAVLLADAPEGQATALPRPDLARLEALLALGASTSAMLELIGSEAGMGSGRGAGNAGYLLSCGGRGQHLASVILPGNAEDITASGDTAALALVGALALALAELAENAAGQADRRAEPRSQPN